MATYKRLTLPQRYLIQTLHHQQKTQTYIAQQLGLSQASISRELAKDRLQYPHQPYQATQVQQRAAKAKTRTPYKLKGDLLTVVISRIRERLSPEQVCGELHRMRNQKMLHHETRYGWYCRESQVLR